MNLTSLRAVISLTTTSGKLMRNRVPKNLIHWLIFKIVSKVSEDSKLSSQVVFWRLNLKSFLSTQNTCCLTLQHLERQCVWKNIRTRLALTKLTTTGNAECYPTILLSYWLLWVWWLSVIWSNLCQGDTMHSQRLCEFLQNLLLPQLLENTLISQLFSPKWAGLAKTRKYPPSIVKGYFTEIRMLYFEV